MPSFSYLKWLKVKFRHVDIIFKPTTVIKVWVRINTIVKARV